MFMLNFPNANVSSEEWCYANDVSLKQVQCQCSVSVSVLKQVLGHVSRRGGGALPYLAYTGQVCAVERKVLSIKQGVEFYYFNSKILNVHFITLMVKFYYNRKFA